jgi:glutamate 5-kinase
MGKYADTDRVDIDKVGNLLVKRHEDGSESLDEAMFRSVAHMALSSTGRKRVIVSSAGITAGMIATGTKIRPDKNAEMVELQRLAGVGWLPLLQTWKETSGKNIGGMLLTKQDLEKNSVRQKEVARVIHTMLGHGDLPVVNENDTVTHAEIAYGNNDPLAASLAAALMMHGSDVRLFLLSDVNGVYADREDPTTRIPVIEDTAAYRHLALDTDSTLGSGGMVTKFDAADIAKAAGVDMWVFNPLDGEKTAALRGDIGTYFPA